MAETWESRFTRLARSKKHSEEFISECIRYKEQLNARNMPVIFDVGHLAVYLGRTKNGLFYLLHTIDSNYTEYRIRKKSNPNETRLLTAPSPSLKQAQRWIYQSILKNDDRMSMYAHGFREGRSVKSNAKPHEKAYWLLTVDLKDFFSNVYANRVYSYFSELGYEKKVCWALTTLCTYQGHLPQGAPTSPCLSNLIAKPLDDEIASYCADNGMEYSRYADDITISSAQQDIVPSVDAIRRIVERNGFRLNHKKTRLCHRGQRMEVAGLTIDDGVYVPKSFRKEILRDLYFCSKYSPESHVARKCPGKGFFKEWMLGRIRYVMSIDPETGKKMMRMFNEVNWLL